MKTIVSLDRAVLYMLGALPIFLYVHGFLLSGVQIFQIKSSGEFLKTKQNITVQNEVKNVDEVLKTQEERHQLLEKEHSKNKAFDEAVSLSTKLSMVKDVEKETLEKEELVKEAEVELEFNPSLNEKHEATISYPKNDNKKIKKRSQHHGKETAATDRLVIKRPSSILGAQDKPNKVVQSDIKSAHFKSLQIDGKFVESGRVEIGKDNVIYLRNTESFKIQSGHIVPKNTVMSGFLSVRENRLHIDVSKVEIRGLNYRADIAVCDANGIEGILLSDVNELFEDSQDELEDIINGSMDNINLSLPMLGSISLLSIRRKDNNKLQVFFDKATEIKLLVKS